MFTEEKPGEVLKKLKIEKLQVLTKSLKFGRREHLPTNFSDYATLYINKTEWKKAYILPFPLNVDLGITKNYEGLALPVKNYNALIFNWIEPEIGKFSETIKLLSKNSLPNFIEHFTNCHTLIKMDKQSGSNTTVRRFLESIQFRTQRKDGTNTTS